MKKHQVKADELIHRAFDAMNAGGVPVSVTIDRLFTFGAALSVAESGAAHTAGELRAAADRIAAGAFAKFEPVRN